MPGEGVSEGGGGEDLGGGAGGLHRGIQQQHPVGAAPDVVEIVRDEKDDQVGGGPQPVDLLIKKLEAGVVHAGNRLVQYQQVGRLCYGGGEVLVLQFPGRGLFLRRHLKDEFLPGLAPVDLRAKLGQKRYLAAVPSLQKLDDDHPLPGPQRTERKTHSGGGLSLSVAPVQMQKSLFHSAPLHSHRGIHRVHIQRPAHAVGQDVELLPQTFLMGRTRVGEDSVIGPNSRLTDTVVGCGCTVDETVAVEARIDDGATCGPRAYLRPAAHLCEGAKAGTHVEIKKSTVGKGSKVPHLSYIGDTTIGEDVNIGAGSITCNYDGKKKWPTTIGDGAFVGSDTMMVAPVNIGAGCIIGAGSCITKDVPADALGLTRPEQRTIEGWAAKKRERQEQA